MTKQTLLALALVLPLAGCSDNADKARVTAAKPIDNPNFQRYDVAIPPKQVMAIAQRVLSAAPYSMTVQPQAKGVLTTDWKQYQGAFHIVRYWQERTRFQVAIYPDFDDPTGHASIRVSQETQTRATDQGTWVALLDEDRSDRAGEVAKAIQSAANAEAGK